MKTIIASLFATLISISVFASETTVQEIPAVYTAHVVSAQVSTNVVTTPESKTRILPVTATLSFSNSCMVPNIMVKEVKVSESGKVREYRLLTGDTTKRLCPAEFKPVTQTYLVDRIYVEDVSVPVIKINGVEATVLE